MAKPSIFDFINRHQIYLEGVKNWYGNDFKRYLKLFAEQLRKLFGKIDKDSLGELTKAQLKSLLKKISDIHNKVFGQYGTEFLSELRRLARVDTVLQRGGFAFLTKDKDFSGATVGTVWNRVTKDVIPAYGMTLKDSVTEFVTRAKHDIVTTITTAHADARTVAESVKEVIGEGVDYVNGSLGRVWNWARAFTATTMQHVSSAVGDVMNGILSDCYQWVSVIDNATTPICRERNGTVYRNGRGPIPPAHIRCRSRTIPVDCDSTATVPTFFAWLGGQASDFLKDAFGSKVAKSFLDGTAKASDYIRFKSVLSLTMDEFEAKAAKLVTE